MKSITFYSYKGGAGRTLAAINFAIYLARLGLRAILLDMDLEAPGIDSKFPGFVLPKGQRGILDYILDFQNTGTDPGSVADLCVEVPVDTPQGRLSVGLIPAGYYLSPDYASKLSKLDWNSIYSKDKDGAAFFQQFLARVKSELKPSYLIIDSRTGISEIGGVCTQQLADEVVILSSLARESVKMTKHLVHVVENGPIAKALNKQIDVKVVLSRIPKDDELIDLRMKYSGVFGIPEKKLFFLFSCKALEQNEFIALLGSRREEELVDNYIKLFHGLEIELADENIKKQVDAIESTVLRALPEEIEARILELVALYPHPEVYRTAMRFYRLAKKADGVLTQGLRLLDIKPTDEEAQAAVVESFLSERPGAGYAARRLGARKENVARISDIAWSVFTRPNRLTGSQLLTLAGFLEDVGSYDRSHTVAMASLEAQLPPEWRNHALNLAARTAIATQRTDVARELIAKMPPESLRGRVAEFAIRTASETIGPEAAFEVALLTIQQDITRSVLSAASEMAAKLDRKSDLVNAILASADADYVRHNTDVQEQLIRDGLQEVLQRLPETRLRRRRT